MKKQSKIQDTNWDLSLDNKVNAFGFGSQGYAHSFNFRDSTNASVSNTMALPPVTDELSEPCSNLF